MREQSPAALKNRFLMYTEHLMVAETDKDREALWDSCDAVLDLAVKLGHVATEPLEDKRYAITFPGRINGEVRQVAHWKNEAA
jgi:hypothetical protein